MKDEKLNEYFLITYQKVINTINSCKNEEQLNVARNLSIRFIEQMHDKLESMEFYDKMEIFVRDMDKRIKNKSNEFCNKI